MTTTLISSHYIISSTVAHSATLHSHILVCLFLASYMMTRRRGPTAWQKRVIPDSLSEFFVSDREL